MDESIWGTVDRVKRGLDAANGHDDHEITCRILKLTEESGEAAAAWIGVLGRNPRKGVDHNRNAVVAELADVAMAALVAIASLDRDPRRVLAECAAKVDRRFG